VTGLFDGGTRTERWAHRQAIDINDRWLAPWREPTRQHLTILAHTCAQ